MSFHVEGPPHPLSPTLYFWHVSISFPCTLKKKL